METLKLTEQEFIIKAVNNLRKPPYRGIHCVYSGFNRAFRDYFMKDPIDSVKALEMAGVVTTKPVKGGVMIYIHGEEPKDDHEDVLKRIIG